MIRFAEWLGHWSVDVYLLASVSLIVAMLAMAALRQPVHRLAVIKSLLIGLGLLAALCAVPNWSVLHLMAAKPEAHRETVRTPVPEAIAAIATSTLPTTERNPANVKRISPPTAPVENSLRLTLQPWPLFGVIELVGAVGVVFWLVCGWAIAHKLRRGAYEAGPDVQELLEKILTGRIASQRDATTWRRLSETPIAHPRYRANLVILLSRKMNVPVALGLRSLAIVLPSHMIEAHSANAISQSELSTVLAHELAHIHNCDLYWLALSRGLLVFFWSHPLYWLARRRMRLDQESLADAAAAELTSREQYAEQLVGWARTLTNARTMRLASAVGLWEGASQLRQRVALLLDERITILRVYSRKWQLSTFGLCIMIAAALSLITLRPGQGAAPAEAPAPPPNILSAPAYEMVSADGIHLPLPKANQLAGQVFDAKHMPIANVDISVFRLRQSDATRKLVMTLKTDKNGKYHVFDFINLTKEFPDRKFPPLRGLGDEYLQIIARSPFYASQSQLESIQDVAQNGDSMLIILQPAATVRGKISDPDGNPVAGALVSISVGPEIQNWSGANSAQTDAAGNYVIQDASPFDLNKPKTFTDPALDSLNLVEAPPTLTVVHPGYATKQAVLQKAPGTQDLSLERPAIIEGTVVYGDSGKPASNVLVQARSEIHGPPAASVNGKLIPIVQAASVRTDANGKYKIETLAQGDYSIWAEANDWTNSGFGIHADSGKTNHVFDLMLTKGGVISVRLVDAGTGKPIPVQKEMTATITASPLPFGTAGHAIMPSNISPTADGRFELHTPPGKMAVSSLYMEDNVARHWLSRGNPVETEVVDGQTVQIDLPVKAASAADVAHGVNSPYAPENQPPAGPIKGISPAPPVAVPATSPPSPLPIGVKNASLQLPNTVRGREIDEKNQPVSGAEVFLFRINEQDHSRRLLGRTKTDNAGHFRFDNVLDVDKEFPGKRFPPSYLADDDMLEEFVRAPGRITTSRLLARSEVAKTGDYHQEQMLPSTTLRGRVTDHDGKPIAGALVSRLGGSVGWEGAQSTRTDANGNYQIEDGPPFDKAEFEKLLAEHERQTKQLEAQGTPAFHVNVSRPVLTIEHPNYATKRVTFDKVPGTTDVQLDPAAVLAGRVIFADSGKPAADVLVGAATSIADQIKRGANATRDFQRVVARTDADGKYRITSLPAGKYDLWADAGGYVNEGENDVVASAGKEENVPDLKFTKGGRVRVRIVDAKTNKPITLPPETRAMILALLPANSRPTGRPLKESWTTPNSASQFELRLIPGKKLLGAAAVEMASQLKFAGEAKTEVNVLDGQTIDVDLPVTALNESP